MRWLWTFVLILVATTSHAAGFKLDWTDNSPNEANFIIERVVGPCVLPAPTGRAATPRSGFVELGATPADVKTYTDTTVAVGQVYCYRVGARNPAGTSYSNLAEGSAPLAIPAAPSGLGVTVLP